MALERTAYTLAIICALPKEGAAIALMFDEVHETPKTPKCDDNSYLSGSIHGKNIVVALLPFGIVDPIVAAQVATLIKPSFPNVECCLLVGIAGALPNPRIVIRLGDVVVGAPDSHNLAAVVQHDRGRQEREFQQASNLRNPPKVLLATVSKIEACRAKALSEMHDIVFRLSSHEEYRRPQTSQDALTRNLEAFTGNDPEASLSSSPKASLPVLHLGVIASGNIIMKNKDIRDKLSHTTNALCIETEAAGVANCLPCLVIRGISDYSDSEKNKDWQNYAALTAAAFAKVLIGYMPRVEEKENAEQKVKQLKEMREAFKSHSQNTAPITLTFHNTGAGTKIAQGVFNNGTFNF